MQHLDLVIISASLSVRRAAATISIHLSLMESPVARWGDSGPPAELKLGDMGLVGVVGVFGVSFLPFLQKSTYQTRAEQTKCHRLGRFSFSDLDL